MKKIIKLMTGVLVVFVLGIFMVGCFGGGVHVRFRESSGGTLKETSYSTIEEAMSDSDVRPALRNGYFFEKWVVNEELSDDSMTVLDPICKINYSSDIFDEFGRTCIYEGSYNHCITVVPANETVSVLILDDSIINNIETIDVTFNSDISGSISFSVYDQYSNLVVSSQNGSCEMNAYGDEDKSYFVIEVSTNLDVQAPIKIELNK